MEYLFLFGFFGATLALVFAAIQAKRVLAFPEGSDVMKRIAASIRTGANAYLKRQSRTLFIFYVVMVVILGILAIFGLASPFIPFAFLSGGLFSQAAAYIGMKIATQANVRTAQAASTSLNQGLKVAFASGTVMSFTVVGLALLDVSIWFVILRFIFNQPPHIIAENMVMFGVGASAFALFARVGGGIFTKAADVGADLVGKIEAGIPEDDPRNPAVIADNVGDNVGDVAGMGADLYESYIKAMHATIALGWAAFGMTDLVFSSMFLPVALAVVGIFASLIGSLFIRTGEKATQKDLLYTLRKGTYIAAILATVAAAPLTYFLMDGNWGLFISILVGVLAGCLIAYFTEYFTSDHYKPTRKLAEASETGAATLIIGGISLGMKSTLPPVVIISASVLISFLASGGMLTPGAYGYDSAFTMGLYGIGLSAVGMLSTLGITLACDAYGPVADNAGGIAQMANLDPEVRERTDALDSLGNTTAATGKGFAIGSAALTSLALVVSFVNVVNARLDIPMSLNIDSPKILIGVFLGSVVILFFTALTLSSAQRAAQSIVHEVRRQFREIPGLMEGTAEADYAKCVDICTKSALREMLPPSLLGIAAPLLTGFVLGPSGVLGLLVGATVTGFAVANFMSNAGGAWDNAKKYIESGAHGGKGSKQHEAAVVGDTVGDPFKDTAGPSLNTLFKLLSTISITFVGIIVSFSIF